jgi:uncharacterized protein YdiU (UPF0061 family)
VQGLAKKSWSEIEIDYLKDNIGMMKITTIADKLDRSENAIVLKAKRLGIANTKNHQGYLNVSELAKLIGKDRKVVSYWTKNCGLHTYRRITHSERSFCFIKPEEFWEWALDNQEKLNFQKIEPNSIPPEPDWVREVRMTQEVKEKIYKNWTTKEMQKLTELKLLGFDEEKIAKKLNRSSTSIKRKLDRMV